MQNKTRKKILYLITKSNWGGAQRYVFDLATHLDTERYDVAVALGGTGQLLDELKRKNVRTISIGNLDRDISVLKELRAMTELWHLIRTERPDVLHINSSKAGGLGAFLGRLLGVPHIIFTAHGWAFNENRPWWQKIIIMKLHWITVMLAHTTIVVSEATKSQMVLPYAKSRMHVIYNGSTQGDVYTRDYARTFMTKYVPALEAYTNDFWSVTVAELHPVKQHDVMIEAMRAVVEKHPQVRHIIIGDGDERKNLETLVQSYGLENNIFFAGHIPNASLYLKAFDLFILTSRSEALAYVIIEACIAGLPIIASNVGGIPEIITHEKNGLLFPQGDAQSLSGSYAKLYENKEMRETLATNAQIRGLDFSFENMFEKTKALYESK